ncbi:MAG: DoxX family protein [Bacteroidota bacterium]
MSTLHEPGINKARKIIGYIISILISAMFLLSVVTKLSGSEEMKENMAAIPNMGDLIIIIGIIELASLILYWIPKTSNLGFFLLCSYCGGIIVAELVAGGPALPGIPIAVLLYIGTFLRKPSLSGLGI